MLVDDPEGLRDWLVKELESAIDADPVAVAKYAVALVRKDLPEEELRPAVCNDLSVFLTESTEKFVERFFDVVKSKSYMHVNESSEAASEPARVDTLTQDDDADSSSVLARRESRTADSDDELSDDDRDHKRTSKRSRSRSPENSQAPSRRISPHRRLGHRRGNVRGGRRGMDMRSRLGRGGYRNDHNARRYDTGSGPSYRRRSRSPRRSLSPRRKSRSPRPRSPLKSGSPPRDILSELTSANSNQKEVKPRCRDYDEKGYCLQGELCKFSHGSDAVVMTDVASLGIPPTQSSHPSVAANVSAASTQELPVPTLITSNQPVRPATSGLQIPEPYNPEAPRLWRPGVPPRMAGPMRPRLMGPNLGAPLGRPTYVPMQPVGNKPMMPYQDHYRPRMPDSNQQGGVKRPRLYDPNRATLMIKNLPTECNNIAKLNEHFSKFGTIINLQVFYEGQADTAIVTFSTNKQANAAHKNPEPLFNNRFIKLFWHNEESNGGDSSKDKPSAKSRLGDSSSQSQQTGFPPKKPRVEPNMNPATLKIDKSAAKRQVIANAAAPSHHKQSVMKQQMELKKKAEALLLEQIKQQKLLLSKAEKCKTAQEKSEIVKTIKLLASSIDKTKADIAKSQDFIESRDKAAKELLDTEMDFYQKQQAGEDTEELRQKLANLKQQVAAMGLKSGRGRGRGGHSRGGRHGSQSKPEPPNALLVAGFKPEEKDEIVAHFKAYGIVTEKEFVVGPPTSVVIEYTKSHDAKVAAIHGAKFKSQNLVLKWYKPPAISESESGQEKAISADTAAPTASARLELSAATQADNVLGDETDDLLDADIGDEDAVDEALLLGDEDDDDNEKRSW